MSALVICASCIDHKPYVCASADQCTRDGVTGVCEPEGFCSFADSGCDTGWRFVDDAGDGLGGTCVPARCGAVGNSCCGTGEGEASCIEGAYCDGSNTCATCVTDVAMGREHGCALRYDGTVWCFGADDVGQLGYGMTSDMPSAMPHQVLVLSTGAPITDVIALGAGRDHTCAVRADGSVWCWGDDGQGQLGDGGTMDQLAAVPATLASDSSPLTGVAEVDGGDCTTCARRGDGSVLCWGCNSAGQLGDGTIVTPRPRAAPVLVEAGGAELTGATALAVGGWGHSCALAGNRALCWGWGIGVGNNTETNSLRAVDIVDAVSVAAGRGHTCIAKGDGSAWCWGSEDFSRLGNGTGDGWDGMNQLTPTQVLASIEGAPITGIASVAAGAVGCALTTDGTALCWGDDRYGQAGTVDPGKTPLPVQSRAGGALTGVDEIFAHFTRTCARMQDGRILCWGKNHKGQLGDGTYVNRGAPVALTAVSCP